MAHYELMYILRPDLDEEQMQAQVDAVSQMVSQSGATVDKVDKWGRRRLSYPIAGHEDGFYVLVTFEGSGPVSNEITRLLNISESVIRSIVVRVDEE